MSTSTGYEFSEGQNRLLASLAGKMRFVGFFSVLLGVLNLLMTILVVLAVYRDRVPMDWKNKVEDQLAKAREGLPPDARKQAESLSLDNLPPNDNLWGIAIGSGATGLFYLFLGLWTRSAGHAFQKIVDTQGNDIAHLMNGMESLHRMYALLYTLLMFVLLLGLVSLGISLWKHFAGG